MPDRYLLACFNKSMSSMLWSISTVVMLLAAVPLSGQIVQGPATGTVNQGFLVSTGTLKNAPATTPAKIKIGNPFWGKDAFPLLDDALDNSIPVAPLGSFQFDDATISGNYKAAAPQTPTLFTDFEAITRTNSIPPDPVLAVGPNHIVGMVNGAFEFYDKTGNSLYRGNNTVWLSNMPGSTNASDPIVIYDHFEGRWVMVWLTYNDASQSSWWILSISDDDNPMGDWYNYATPADLNGTTRDAALGDYEKVGFDHQAIYISGNQFLYPQLSFGYSKLRIVPKAALYANNGGTITYTDFWDFKDPNNAGVTVFGPPIIANHMDTTNTAYVVLDSPYLTANFISLWKINDPVGSPTMTGTNIPTSAVVSPSNAAQLGGATPLNVGGRRYMFATYQNGSLYTANAIGAGMGNAFTGSRYLRINPETNTLLEEATISANQSYYFYPAATVDADDNLFMVFGRSGQNEYASAAYTGRRANDDPGLAPSGLIKAGEASYVALDNSNRNRWGDYMGIWPDPAYPNLVWGMVEYADSPANNWSTWIGAMTYNAYHAVGVISDAVSSDPIQYATVSVVETATFKSSNDESDENGNYLVATLDQSATINVSAFAYQPTQVVVSLTANDTDVVDIALQPEVQAVFAGQVVDPSTSTGVAATLSFYAEGNPEEGPYLVLDTDASGNFNAQTIIGTYDIVVEPDIPYAVSSVDSQVLTTAGLNINIEVQPADVFVIDDTDGSDYSDFYLTALSNSDNSHYYWNVVESGVPASSDMGEFPSKIVLWYTGDGVTTLSAAEQTELVAHWNNGGRLFITGQNIAEQNSGSGLLGLLGIEFATNISSPVIAGFAGEFTEGLAFSTLGSGGAGNQNSRDQLAVIDSSVARTVFGYSGSAALPAGVASESGQARAVFLGFGVEGINNAAFRRDVVEAVVDYLKGATGIGPDDGAVSDRFQLAQNYPNPFNPNTTIQFNLGETAEVKLMVVNVRGQEVQTLASGKFTAGEHRVVWDAKDSRGATVASGVYLYRLEIDGRFNQTRKMILLR